MNTKLILGAAFVCVVGAFFVGRQFPASSVGSADRILEDGASGGPGKDASPMLDSQNQVIARLTAELETERKKVEELSSAAKPTREEIERLYKEHFPTRTEGAPAGGTPYAPETYKAAIAGVSWPEAGEAAARMVPRLDPRAQDFVSGKPVTQEVGLEIFKWNQKLQQLAVTAIAAKVPGAGGNGAFTHPIVTINLIHAALADAGVPLGPTQIESLRSIGDRFLEEDARRTAGYDDETFELQKTIDECALKDRMFADIHAVLTGKQNEVLHPEAIRGRMGIDIYSSGTIWYAVSQPVDFETREDLAAGLVQHYLAQDKLSEEETTLLKRAAKDWADSFSSEFLEASADPTAQASRKNAAGGMLAGWQKVTQATLAAAHQLALNRALLELVGRDSPKAAMIRADGGVLIPIRRP